MAPVPARRQSEGLSAYLLQAGFVAGRGEFCRLACGPRASEGPMPLIRGVDVRTKQQDMREDVEPRHEKRDQPKHGAEAVGPAKSTEIQRIRLSHHQKERSCCQGAWPDVAKPLTGVRDNAIEHGE